MDLRRPLATVTPTLDGDVLTVLAQREATFTPGELQRVLRRYSEAGVRKVLLRLTGQGVVYADRVGSAYTYRLNRDHLAAEAIITLAHLQDALLARVKEHLAGWPVPPVYAAVFGSAARGEMTAGSDLDVLLIRHKKATDACWDAQVHELSAAVTAWTGNDTRPLVYGEAQLAAAAREPVLRDVAHEGLTVAGTPDWLTRQLRHHANAT